MTAARKSMMVMASLASLATALMPGCASTSKFGEGGQAGSQYQAEIDQVKGYPTASQILSAPPDQNTQAQWDAKAEGLLALEKVFTQIEADPAPTTASTQARAKRLRSQLYAYEYDDYQAGLNAQK